MSSINKYLVHTVDIVHVTMTKGVRSMTITTDVAAFLTEKEVLYRDAQGDHFGTRTIVFLRGDTDVEEKDELIIEGKQRPIVNIHAARDLTPIVHHLEVEVS
mgnify:CR=1 FL=1